MAATKQITDILLAVQRACEQGEDLSTQDGWRIQRVRAGMNNALYRVSRRGQAYAVKLCVNDERRRAQREHAALRTLQRARVDIAPRPLGLDESAAILPYPAVVYHWLPGAPLSEVLPARGYTSRVNTEEQFAALLESIQLLHGVTPQRQHPMDATELTDAWFHWFDRRPYLEELDGFLEQYRSWLCEKTEDGEAIYARLERIVAACAWVLNESPARIDRDSTPLRLCHVDPNPANAIWGGDGRVRWVDWEYSGWGDPALDLAEFRWHEAFAFMSVEQAAWMRAHYMRAHYQPPPGDEGFAQRLALWDALLAARWPFLLLRWLWSLHNGPDRERLSMPQMGRAEVQQRMLRLIERAEEFYEIRSR